MNVTLAITAYLLTSVLFLFGRVQLGTLFRAETELAKHEHQKGGGPAE
jgi:hypothetical protein